jgi:outer membrane protein, heavy metal efflux system
LLKFYREKLSMGAMTKRLVFLLAIFWLTGCAVQRYRPAPIVPGATASQFEARSLADAGLRSFEEKTLGRPVDAWPPQSWDQQKLSLAALYFNPALDLPRARLDTAHAAIVTAKARPNPTIDLVPGVPSPYLLTQDVLILIETAGKRERRVDAARSLDEAAQFDLADSAWTVVISVRQALLNYLVADRTLELLRSEEKVREHQVAILEKVLSAGEITSQLVDPVRIDLSKTQVSIRTAESQVIDARAALAAAIGLPLAGLDGAEFSWPEMDAPPSPESLSADQMRRDAVLNRLDIRRALAQYAAAEANMQAEIAKQYPNISIGPGYTFEETHSFFTLGISTTLPIFNHNQGPIAEADGRRKEAAAAFLQAQVQVIEKGERALTGYRSALKEVAAARSLYERQQRQRQAVERTIRAGADSASSLDAVDIQISILARAHLDALARAQGALGNLEDAVQRPLAPGEMLSVSPESLGRGGLSKGAAR